MSAPARVVTLGELLLRLSPPPEERLLQTSQLRTWFGGSEANVAVSLARFGLRSDYVTRLPDNALGEAALRALRAEAVGTEHIRLGGSRLGLYFVEPGAAMRPMRVIYDRAGSSFSETPAGSFDWPRILAGADWLHLSAITPALSASATVLTIEAVRAARATGARISLDLNYREALWQDRDAQPMVRPLAESVDLLIANAVAVEKMLGSAAHAEQLATALGCRWVAITQREASSASEHSWGAMLYDSTVRTLCRSPGYRVQVVDRVGGGDAFAAGLVHALLTGREQQDALNFAAAAGALKLTLAGDWNLASVTDVERVAAEKSRSES